MGNGIIKMQDLSDELVDKINSQSGQITQLSGNDLKARDDIMDIKLKLREQSATSFLNKSGIGFYDTFIDNSSIDAANTTSTYNSTNKAVDFTGSKSLKMVDESFDTFNNLDIALYPSKINKCTVSGAVNNSATVNLSSSDKVPTVGDKLFMSGLLNEVLNSTANFTVYDKTTPVSTVNSSYVTSATARPQRLSNGWWLYCALDNVSKTLLKFYISKDESVTWELLTTLSITGVAPSSISFAICSYQTKIYGITTYYANSTNGALFFKFDAATIVGNLSSSNYSFVETSQTSFGSGCSIAVNSTGTEISYAVSSKNSTYSGSFNIRSSKSTDEGSTWLKQDGSVGTDQITYWNSGVTNALNPYLIYDKNNIAKIFFNVTDTGSTYYVYMVSLDNIVWPSCKTVYSGSTYSQSNPNATLQRYGPNAGRIWVVWYGLDSTDTTKDNIRILYSDDNGVTWSTTVKLTSGNSYQQQGATIATDIDGNVYVIWGAPSATSATCYNIRMIKYDGISWGTITEITNQSAGHMFYPTICDNYYNFTNPITIWQNNANSQVSFYGKWQVGQGYILTMQNPTTLADGVKVPIVDLLPQQNGTDLTIDNIDTEKFTFKGINLNTTIASLKVNGKDNSLNALAYAVA